MHKKLSQVCPDLLLVVHDVKFYGQFIVYQSKCLDILLIFKFENVTDK